MSRPTRSIGTNSLVALGLALIATSGGSQTGATRTPTVAGNDTGESVEVTRARCHHALESPGDWHDVFATLIEIGDRSSVPYLIDALKSAPAPNDGGGIECTWTHCETALRRITNTSFGLDVNAWQRWWASHKSEPRIRWLWDGFVARGYRLNENDHQGTVLTLLEAASDKEPFTDTNANDLLTAQFEACEVDQGLKTAKSSEVESVRTGAVLVLGLRGQRDALRPYLTDPSGTVSELARTKMDKLLAPSSKHRVLLRQHLAESIGTMAAGRTGKVLYLGLETRPQWGTGSQLMAFSLERRQPIWSFACDDVVTSVPVLDRGRVFFVSGNRTVRCLEEDTGALVWATAIEPDPGRRPKNTVIVRNDRLFLADDKGFLCIDADDGRVLWRVELEPATSGFVWDDQAIFTHTFPGELCRLSYDGQVLSRVRVGFPYGGLALDEGTLYFWAEAGQADLGSNMDLVACDGVSFEKKWATGVGAIWNWGNASPLVTGDALIVSSDSHVVAIEKASGRVRWSVQDGADTEIVRYDERRLLLKTDPSEIAMRDVATGELVFRMDEPGVFEVPLVLYPNLVFGDMKGNLWIVDPGLDSAPLARVSGTPPARQ